MTSGLRTLFEERVEPLLELLWARNDLAQEVRAQKKAENALAKSKVKLGEAEDAWYEEEEGTPASKKLRAKVKRIGGKRAEEKQQLKEAYEAILTLSAQVEEIEQRPGVAPALAELEAPIRKSTKGKTGKGTPTPAPPSASSAPSAANATAGDAKPSASVPRKPKTDDGYGSWLATLLLEHPDPTTTMLDFLDVKSALSGIGTASQGVRAAVKAGLPRLGVKPWQYGSGSGPQLGSFHRLQTLRLTAYCSAHLEAHVPQILSQSLPARLQSLAMMAYESSDRAKAVFESLFSVSVEWPQLEVLEVREEDLFLDVIIARPTIVFPRLRCILGSREGDMSTAKLAMLLNRGAFPALLSLYPFKVGSTGRAEDITQEIALLEHFPGQPVLQLGVSYRTHAQASLDPFINLVANGGLSNLTTLTCYPGDAPSGEQRTSLLSAIGSGALPNLETLDLQEVYNPHAIMTGSNIIPGSLPALRTLRINLPLADDVIACLLGAAGAQLSALDIDNVAVAITTARLVADNDYCWLPALKTLSLPKVVEPQGTFAQRIVTALSRLPLPALRTLEIALSSSDEMLVRLLALADSGGLPNLAQLRNESPSDHLSDGALLLLLMWFKREAKKAREGQPSAALWDLTGIRAYRPAGFAKLAAQIHRVLEAMK